MENILYIKNMVCDRCKMAVKNELEKSGLRYRSVELGEVVLSEPPSPARVDDFKNNITQLGFELIEDKTSRMVSQIKNTVIAFVRDERANKKFKFSSYLTGHLDKDYNYLSNLFSALEGVTIEQYLIHQKIERVKELLVYDELSLSEIAHDLGYSSVQHLSNQFKKITGLTPTHFKKVKEIKRKSLDQI